MMSCGRRFLAASHFLDGSNTLKKGNARALFIIGDFNEIAITNHFNPIALTT
jgi:hypothetical protein